MQGHINPLLLAAEQLYIGERIKVEHTAGRQREQERVKQAGSFQALS